MKPADQNGGRGTPPRPRRPDMARLARLACLEIPPADRPARAAELEGLLALAGRLGGPELRGIAPPGTSGRGTDRLREDRPGPPPPSGRILANAPEFRDGLFRVPPILE